MQNSAFCRRESRGKSKSFKTENSEKTESLALSFSRSATAPSRREPLFVRVFFFVPQRKQEQKSRFQNRKQQKNKSLALSFSRSATAPSRREPMTVRVFSLCRRENKDKIQGSKLKVRTFFFCGSAVRQPLPSSGRKVSRTSVTEGARGTEKTAESRGFFGVSTSIPQSLRDSSLCTREPWVDAKFGFLPQRKQRQK